MSSDCQDDCTEHSTCRPWKREWARWPWQKCPSRRTTGMRCDLKRRHDGPCRADRGIHDCEWVADVEWVMFNTPLERH